MKKIFLLLLFCSTQFFASAQWIQLNSGTTYNLTGVSFINSDTGFAVGWSNYSGIVLKTTDGGLTWNSIPYDTTAQVYGVSFPTAQAGYISGNGFIKKTTDHGNTWTTVKNGSEYGQMQFLNDSEGYVLATYPNRFVKTLDGGQTWTDLPNNLWVWDFDFSSVDTGMAADRYLKYEVSRTFDGGVTWTQSLVGGTYGPIFLCINHIENQKWCAIKASFNDIDADLTFDAGQGWMNLTMDSVPPQPYTLVPYRDATFTSATTGWAVGGTYIINTHDGGYTWAVNDTNPDTLYKVNFPNPHVGYAVGENGLIMKYVEPATTTQDAEALQQLFIFPDPAQDYLFINLGSPGNLTTIRVYNLQGRMIVLPTTFSNAQIQLNTATLPDGFYTLQIIDNNTGKTRMKKFVKQE